MYNLTPTPEVIRARMLSAGLTMKQSAELLGVANSTFEAWIYNRTMMPKTAWRLFVILTREKNQRASD